MKLNYTVQIYHETVTVHVHCTQNEMKSLCFSNVIWNETINNYFWIAVTSLYFYNILLGGSGFDKSVKIMSF